MSHVCRLQAPAPVAWALLFSLLSELHSLPTAVSSWSEAAVSVLLIPVALEESLVTPPDPKLGL